MDFMIGEKIRFLREKKGITQKELASKLKCNERMIGLYEKNKHSIRFETIKKIADFFDVSLDYFDFELEVYNIPKLFVYNNRCTEELIKTVVGILDVAKNIKLKDKKILLLNLGSNRFDELKIYMKFDSKRSINILGIEFDIFVKDNIEMISFTNNNIIYKNSCNLKIEKILNYMIKIEDKYGLILGFGENIIDNAMIVNNYLSLCDKVIIPFIDFYTIRQGEYTMEKILNLQYFHGEVIILRYQRNDFINEYKEIENIGKFEIISNFRSAKIDRELLEYLQIRTDLKLDINNFMRNIENKTLIKVRMLKNIAPLWKMIPKNEEYFSYKNLNELKDAYSNILDEINVSFNISN
ncbi:helix-turn-helix domain-containing protein [Clostridium perfringens]|uniref:helix-turn-helix domain-containing protein n=1 Tax=Clostridium perfringens TaxID=1502 RepID=UPI000E187796|nr:helix-turn-helix transcriptional regulator [Clostridium perfringens]MDU2659106.1 helix-turn-helix transcriptional regulator [Clostridium perfringens]STB10809.1 putative transcriptional regulator [Clostridium novyi]SUY37892.1 putative transcriptional regulator [Clostridium perfringens]